MQLGIKRNFSQFSKEEEKIKRRKINTTSFEEVISIIEKDKNSKKLQTNFSQKNLLSMKRENSCQSTLNSKYNSNLENLNPELKRAFSYSNLQTQIRQNFKRSFGELTNIQNLPNKNNFLRKNETNDYLKLTNYAKSN